MTEPLQIAKTLSQALNKVPSEKIPFVYNPLDYAWSAHADYLKKYGMTQKKILFLGMNPGPWGMAQTGVPFGEVAAVKDWLQVTGSIGKPKSECRQKPVQGFACKRSEVSGRRLWGFFKEQFGSPQKFFAQHMVLNYCPLLFLDEGGRNLTPDKIPIEVRKHILEICDAALHEFVTYYQPQTVIGVGAFAKACFERVIKNPKIQIASILHPSPASPAANRDWAGQVVRQLQGLKVLASA